jgi:hypothetical protein
MAKLLTGLSASKELLDPLMGEAEDVRGVSDA